MNTAYLLLGSNEGDRMLWLDKAIARIGATCGTITKRSRVYETAAWGLESQPDFLNMVVQIEATLPPQELLAATEQIETNLGRQRSVKWGPRTLDIDILLYNHAILQTDALVIPHPYLHLRRFTLLPLAEIAPDYEHPLLHKTITILLAECPDPLEAHVYHPANGD